MRRLFAILLLLLMPVQFAFAAAAPYCAMEKIETPTHFGHHEHADNAGPSEADGKDGLKVTADCEICHLASAQTPAAVALVVGLTQAALVRALPNDRQPQHLQEPSERPPRFSLA